MDKPLINKVAQSGLVVINLENYFPDNQIHEFDLKPFLFKELILKEKDFRQELKTYDWSQYSGATVLVYNSNDAIIPVWAYMLVASYLVEAGADIFQGTKDVYLTSHYNQVLESLSYETYIDQRIIIKGCSNKPVPPSAYAKLTANLRPHAKSIMYGEPCSTVPIYKKSTVRRS